MSEENEDWYLPWEQSEIRERDPADFFHEKGDCCWDRARFVAEIPRSRRVGLNEVEAPPARFRLCTHHATILREGDSLAAIYPMKGSASE